MKNEKAKSFIEIINQNIGITHKVARIYFRESEDREDVIQEMMYQLWKSYPSFSGQSKFSTWMYSVCLNTAITYRKKYVSHSNQPLNIEHYQYELPDYEDEEDGIRQLFKAIANLSVLNKAVILLYLESMSYEEIAEVTGLAKSNVSIRLVRIKKELEIQLKHNI
ncbi:MAG: sigma-70 family RNA polymerase sigma factor [Bacteroidales bacterium]|nr:sigma-70 family RNA polymerase sigma factor [Bacteroidales bacterium]